MRHSLEIERENMYLHFSDLDIVLYFLAVWCCEYNLKWQPGHAISILIDGPEGLSKNLKNSYGHVRMRNQIRGNGFEGFK